MIEETTPQVGDTQLPGSGDVDDPTPATDVTATTTPAGTNVFGTVPAPAPEDDDVLVMVPRPAGQYGVPQVDGHQIIYDVVDGIVRVRPEHLDRFLFVVEGSRVQDQPVPLLNVPIGDEELPAANLRQAMPPEQPAVVEPPAATPAAVKAADAAGVDLVDVAQSQGVDKVTKSDVAAHVDAQAAAPIDNQVEGAAPAAEPASAPAEPPAAVETAGTAPAEVPTEPTPSLEPVAEAPSTVPVAPADPAAPSPSEPPPA